MSDEEQAKVTEQEQPDESGPSVIDHVFPDWALEDVVRAVEKANQGITVTLVVLGKAISGTLCPRRQWATRSAQGLPLHPSAPGELLGPQLREYLLGDDFNPSGAPLTSPVYCHLEDVTLDGVKLPAVRVRLANVGAWAIGS